MSNYEIIGWVGSASYLISYFLLSINKLKSNSIVYQSMNVIGAICLIASAYNSNDGPNLFTNFAWMCIGLIAIMAIVKKRK